MVTQYVYDGFEGGMSEKECGDFITVEDYFALQERHHTFLVGVRCVLDAFVIDRSSSADADLVTNLEAIFRVAANPQETPNEDM
jgi:hypothetical protein